MDRFEYNEHEPVSEFKKQTKNNWLRQDEMAPYNAIGLVPTGKLQGPIWIDEKKDRDLKLFFRLLETNFNQEPFCHFSN